MGASKCDARDTEDKGARGLARGPSQAPPLPPPGRWYVSIPSSENRGFVIDLHQIQ